MRLSRNLRRYRWAVFAAWLLLLVPSIYLAMNQSGNLTGGGFEVEGSQSLHVQRELEQHFPDQGASPLALVAAPRADASFEDMTAAVTQLERIAAEVPSVKVVPNPRSRRPSRTARTSSPCNWTSTTPARSTSPNSCGRRSASTAISRARSRTERSSSTSSARAHWVRPRRWPPNTTSRRPSSGTCRSF